MDCLNKPKINQSDPLVDGKQDMVLKNLPGNINFCVLGRFQIKLQNNKPTNFSIRESGFYTIRIWLPK
jgi:hypothetical protein